MRMLLVIATLFAFWLALSGIYTPWMISIAAVSAVASALIAGRKGVLDSEGVPLAHIPGALAYLPWLIWQIWLSGLRVARIVLDPKLPISPSMVRVEARQRSTVGLTIYANSITLTPGTLSVEVSQRERAIWVHALERAGAEGFADDPMNARVARLDEAAAG